MGADPIRRILALSPRGQTSDQLIWRLKAGGVRLSGDQLLVGLQALQHSGEIMRDRNGRWIMRRLAGDEAGRADAARRAGGMGASSQGEASVLTALSLRVMPEPASSDMPESNEGTEDAAAPDPASPKTTPTPTPTPPWEALLSYYESTLRLDPRGSIQQFPDRHETQFQLFRASGNWWRDAALVSAEDAVPATLREALARRNDGVLALGYPLCVFVDEGVTTVVPALLIPARWAFAHGQWRVSVTDDAPSLNPRWLKAMARRTRQRPEVLAQRILGDDPAPALTTLVDTLARSLATHLAAPLRPGELAGECPTAQEGIHNAAALFLPDESSFTRAAADDIARMAAWEEGARRACALGGMLGAAPVADRSPGAGAAEPATRVVLNVDALSASQLEAATTALNAPLTVIQGPPGTGKSQVIVSLIATLAMTGHSVLFASRNHQPLDEVGERLAGLAPGQPFVVRTRDQGGEQDTGFVDILQRLADEPQQMPPPDEQAFGAEERLTDLLRLAREREAILREERERAAIDLRLSEHVERARRIRDHLPADAGPVTPQRMPGDLAGFIGRIRALLRRLFGRRESDAPEEATLGPQAGLAELDAVIARDRARLAQLGPARTFPESDDQRLCEAARALFPVMMRKRLDTGPDGHTLYAERIAALAFGGKVESARLDRDDAQSILARYPVWISPALSAPKRIPLHPGLFDVVIFDEASQCDIGSALPLLARAKRAVVVGDPMQLSFIPGLNLRQENALMDAAGLPRAGREKLAQSVNSLFRFADMRPIRRHAFLADQFRSAGPIVDYLNDAFYRGRLQIRRKPEDFVLPGDYRPGLDWHDVQGVPETAPEGGAFNEAEAQAIIAHVAALAEKEGFDGSVGILSPFNAQIALLRRLAAARLPESTRKRLDLKIATIDRFQGGQADIILFSLVAGPRMARQTLNFLARDRRRINVAVSRARALCIVFGDQNFARESRIAHIAYLAERAGRTPRRDQTAFESLWERRMAAALERRGLAYEAQYPVGWRRLDFALFRDAVKLDLEVDGRAYHMDADGNRKIRDIQRDREMIARGWKVRRFWVHELDHDMEACLDIIERDLAGH